MPELSQAVQKFIQRHKSWSQSLEQRENIATIHVDEVASAIASFYEKIRGAVEWQEERLLRRMAIKRVLTRRLFLQQNEPEMAEDIVLELIRDGHFPNDRIEETKIEDIKNTLGKYFFILENSPRSSKKNRLSKWLLNIAVCEIEEILSPPFKEKSLIDYMAELMEERIEVIGEMTAKEKETQILIACQKALFKFDKNIISYSLLKKNFPDWEESGKIYLKEIALNIYSVWESIEKSFRHPLAEKFAKICERYDTAYLIVGDIVSQNIKESRDILANPETLEKLVRQSYQTRFQKIKKSVKRAAVYSTISIFATKMLLAFAIEIPFDKYRLGRLNWQVLGFNILIPPFLMFLLVLFIRPPKKENLDRAAMEVMKIVYEKEKKDIYPVRPLRKKRFVLNLMLAVFYLLTFLVAFGALSWGLNKLNFSAPSIIIFLMFVSLISFAGVKIRELAKELQIIEEKAGFLNFFSDSLSLPFITMGRWLSNEWEKYNVISFLITALIDVPLQILIEFLEHWRAFLKEREKV